MSMCASLESFPYVLVYRRSRCIDGAGVPLRAGVSSCITCANRSLVDAAICRVGDEMCERLTTGAFFYNYDVVSGMRRFSFPTSTPCLRNKLLVCVPIMALVRRCLISLTFFFIDCRRCRRLFFSSLLTYLFRVQRCSLSSSSSTYFFHFYRRYRSLLLYSS